jgi:hypothetical protein
MFTKNLMIQNYNNPFKLYISDYFMDNEKRLKMAVISGASHALNFRNEHPRANDDEVIQHITREIDGILKKIDEEE